MCSVSSLCTACTGLLKAKRTSGQRQTVHTHPFLSNYVRFLRRRTCNCCFWGRLWAERLLEKSLDLTLASVTTWATVVLEQPDTFEIRASCVSDVNGSGIHNPVVLELQRVNFVLCTSGPLYSWQWKFTNHVCSCRIDELLLSSAQAQR